MSRSGPPPRRPPPLKRRKGAGGSKKRDAVKEALEQLGPVSEGPSSAVNDEGADVEDPFEGEWLYKEAELLKGPVFADFLVEQVREGVLALDTPIAREVGKWKPLSRFAAFVDAHAEGESKRQAVSERKEQMARRQRRQIVRLVLAGLMVMVPFIVATTVGYSVMLWRPWDRPDAWLDRPPPLLDLPPKSMTPTPPPPKGDSLQDKIALAPIGGNTDSVGDIPLEPLSKKRSSKGAKNGHKNGRHGKKGRKQQNVSKQGKQGRVASKKQTSASGKGKLPRTLTNKQVTAGLLRGKKSIGACLKGEFKRNPEMPSVVTVTFSVNNEGHAIQIKLKERQVRKGKLATCLRSVVSKLAWPAFYGERKYVEFPFKIGGKRRR